MRIDFNFEPQRSTETTRGQEGQRANSSAAGPGAASASREDQAQLSGAHVQIQALAAQAAQLPDVRQERVQALRQAIQSGQYRARAEQIAGAVFDHMLAQTAA